jgi:hypothetical protein
VHFKAEKFIAREEVVSVQHELPISIATGRQPNAVRTGCEGDRDRPGVLRIGGKSLELDGAPVPSQEYQRRDLSRAVAFGDGGRMVSRPSAAAAEIVVRTMRRASSAGQGRPRCMVARLSHMTTSPLRQLCT